MQEVLHEVFLALPVIISLIIIEGLLSVDNALAIAAMAAHLPGEQKYRALRWGIVGAYVFRGLALAGAAYIIANPWLKIVGAAYLVHLMASYFAERTHKEDDDGVEEIPSKMAGKSFWATVIAIEIMDLSLSVDNVVAAVALSPKLWIVCTGVFIGILALRFVAGLCLKLIARFPVLESTAFVLIGFVGAILVVEVSSEMLDYPIVVHSYEKFIGIVLILAVAFWYSESPRVKTTLKPVFRALRVPMVGYAAVSNVVFSVVTYPFKALVKLALKPFTAKKKEEAKEPRVESTTDR
jgi:YkoY family integral membrane protein